MKPFRITCAIIAFLAASALSQSLILKQAADNENTFTNGELISVLRGDVEFQYDIYTIRSQYAKWWRSQGIVEFADRVEVFEQKQRLTCDRMRYTKSDSTLVATGRVLFVDSKENMNISGDRCRYLLHKRRCYLTGNPKLMRIDTVAGDTLSITAKEMSYDDSAKVTIAKDQVVIKKGLLLTKCQLASYYTQREIAHLRIMPDILYEDHKLVGDSVDLIFRNDTIRSIAVMGNSRGRYTERTSRDTSITNVRGDSIYMMLNDSGYLDTVWVHRNVKAIHHPLSDSLRSNEASGKIMQLAFAGKGQVQRSTIWGNAMSTYHIVEDNGTGRNEASGDSLSVWFEDGRARRLRLTGNVRGTYFPQ